MADRQSEELALEVELPELEASELEVLELFEEAESPSLEPELESPDRFFFFPDLKSVSYQPPPFSRKPAADTFFTRALSLHFGQSVKGASLTFCRVSNSCPQFSHRYS